ncbi:right-handed parallel beta-helix repeat-containing protein [Natronorubrum halophilum]|uniref:right-handed parallel beta-helix repeat-containing protein n=1 Tax=Natronorubrum halophilum TaxID=1702106 RepID=UPI000EF70302|nr:right-handed parallel beta-helix repeat-containing protein [Natronorubrum halophilum]
MVSDQEKDGPRTNEHGTSRRSFVGALAVSGVSGGIVGRSSRGLKGSNEAASTQGPWQGIDLSDSGTNVTNDLSHLDLGQSLAATELEGDNSFRVDLDVESPNPNIVNVRTDLGVESNEDDLWVAIYDHYQSFSPSNRNHMYVVPPGTWLVETNNIHLEAHEFFGISGNPSATLRVNDQDVDRLMTVGTTDDTPPNAQRTVMQDLAVDIRGDYDAGIGRWYTYRFGLIERITMLGTRNRLHPEYGGDRHTIMVDGIKSTSTNLIRGCDLNNWDVRHDAPQVGHAVAYSSEPSHVGLNVWEGCQVTGYTDNGFYMSTSNGRNLISGCTAVNCAGAGIRIGDNDMVRNCKIIMREEPAHSWSGLWLENGGGQVVEKLYIRNLIQKPTEIIRCTQSGQAQLKNVHINDDGGNGRTIRVNDNDDSQTTFSSCTITDRSSPTTSDYGVYVQSSNVQFRDCDFDFESRSGNDRHGIFVNGRGENVDTLGIANCSVDADGASLRFADSGEKHHVQNSIFEALVMSDADASLTDVLWLGNHHEGDTVFHGARENWKGDFNWGFEV